MDSRVLYRGYLMWMERQPNGKVTGYAKRKEARGAPKLMVSADTINQAMGMLLKKMDKAALEQAATPQSRQSPVRGITASVPSSQKVKFHEDSRLVVSNMSGYSHKGSENFEHDNTGSVMNYSGVEDEVHSAEAVHQDWEAGYDY